MRFRKTSAVTLAAAATASFVTLGAEAASAHSTGDCRFARGTHNINGHACVTENSDGSFTVSAHDAAVGSRDVYIKYHNASDGKTRKLYDGRRGDHGPSYRSGRGNITGFTICEESHLGRDRCMSWDST